MGSAEGISGTEWGAGVASAPPTVRMTTTISD